MIPEIFMQADIRPQVLPVRGGLVKKSAMVARSCFLVALLASLAVPASAQVSALTEQLLDDCDVMTGKKPSEVFDKALVELRKDAKEGRGRGKLYAQIANNRFACFEEEISGNAGWSMTIESGKGKGVSETQSPLAVKLEKNPKALEALRESVSAQRLIADGAPDYGLIAARQMLKYLPVYQNELPGIYTLAGRGAGVYCNYARPKGIRQDWKYLCSDARQIQNELLQKIDKATRDTIDEQNNQWASEYAQSAKYKRHE
jgi:peptidyl-tRNA hydrolase